MKHLLLGVAILAFAQVVAKPSASEPISVISGEHDGFTRLVLELPEKTSWEIENDNGKSILTLNGFDEGFDLTEAFSIIPRTRLTSLIARDSVLEMQLACACPVRSYMEQGRFLVLDINDGAPLEDTLNVTVEPQEIPNSVFGVGDLLWSRSRKPSNTSRKENELVEELPLSNTDERSQVVLAETQNRLLKALSDAASRNILAMSDEFDMQSETEIPVVDGAEVFDSSSTEITSPNHKNSNMRVTSSRDIPQENTQITDLTGRTCPNADIVNIRSWNTSDDFSESLAKSNANLFDEAGRLRPEEVLRRAKLYIYFGFGAEARQTLSLDSTLVSRRPELLDLANILETGFARNPRYLHQFSDCDSDLALWGMLSAKSLTVGKAVNSEAALRALKLLPTHLQFYLAEKLATRLVEIGDDENAQITVSIYKNLEENFQDRPLLISVRIEEQEKNSQELLYNLTNQNHSQTPEAVVQLIDHHVRNDIPVPADIALLAEAFATELRATDTAHEMQRAFILAAIKSSQFEKAYASLDNLPMGQIANLERELVSAYFAEFSNVSSDAAFLDGVFRKLPSKQNAIEPSVRKQIGARLLELGFPSKADQIVNLASDEGSDRQISVLYAQLALNEENFERTLSFLGNLDSQEAELLRGEAFQALRQPERAAQAFRNAENEVLAASALWLSNQWSSNISPNDPVFGRMQEVASYSLTDVTVTDNMLANTQEQIEASTTARKVIETLLKDLSIRE